MTPTSTTARLPAAETARAGRILIVDDRPEKLLALEAALAILGREMVKATSGREALRCLLQHDFAVVVLDIQMPLMDGFETARLIRQRRRNADTPIIFITSYGEEMHALHEYPLGPVDFMLAPLIPEVLCSKVGVFLELYERTAEVREQARRLLLRTQQLQGLARASLKIHAAQSIDDTLRFAAEAARSVLGSRCGAAAVMPSPNGLRQVQFVVSPSQAGAPAAQGSLKTSLPALVAGLSKPARFALADQESLSLSALFPATLLATTGLIAPLVGRDGNNMGLLVAAGKRDGEFSDDEESLLVQLAQMTATAVENTLFAEARESNRIKDEFLATLSHELRTPLSSILGWAQLLRTQMLDAEETAEALDIIERNAEIQCNLIEELLDVSRIVTGKIQLHMQSVVLDGVIRAAVDVMRPAAQAKQVAVDLALSASGARIQGDADRLQQIFWNLLSNAVKFTPPGGHVRATLEAEGEKALVIVEDDGEGIALEFLPYVFDRFRQADSSTSRRHGGLGIGLAVVRHLVELHGGAVRAESEGRGRGTKIIVTLPLAQPPHEASPDQTPPDGSAGLVRELQNRSADGHAGAGSVPKNVVCGV